MHAAAPMRFLSAAFWPLSVWTSLGQFNQHDADDYVERTFPIIATAIGFWICVGLLVFFTTASGTFSVFDGEGAFETVRRVPPDTIIQVLFFILPALYVIGFWLFTAREERYRR